MPNDRLQRTLRSQGYERAAFADELGVDPKTIERWITTGRKPHRRTAERAARLLQVPAVWLWPELEDEGQASENEEICAFYAHRAETPKHLWLDLMTQARENIDILAYAALFLVEENPDVVAILKHKAANGTRVRIALGNPDAEQIAIRGHEEQLYDAIPARIRMSIAYFRPAIEAPDVAFRLHHTALYNSIFRFDRHMLVNQHIYGMYGYVAPVLHLRQLDGADLYDTYHRSFERVWGESYPVSEAARHGPPSDGSHLAPVESP